MKNICFTLSILLTTIYSTGQAANNQNIWEAAAAGNLAVIENFLNLDPNNVYIRDINGRTLLHNAVESIELTRLLLNKGANAQAETPAGETPLHLATLLDKPDVVQLLLNRGALVDKMQDNPKFSSALHIAIHLDNVEIARILLARGANPILPNMLGKLPLEMEGITQEMFDLINNAIARN